MDAGLIAHLNRVAKGGFKGLGGALLTHRLEVCDSTHMPAYLETQKPENLPFYERFGFSVLEEITDDGCPTLWTMWRDPRPA